MAFSEKKLNLTPNQAREKIKHYCAWQERCHSEVKEKLYGFGLYGMDIDTIISELIEENYLNEERFAILYAGGHFRTKQWGKVKITYSLKQKGVSAFCIKKALQQIDLDDYDTCLQKLALTKWNTTKGQIPARQTKCRNYLLQKGYESGLVMAVLQKLAQETKASKK